MVKGKAKMKELESVAVDTAVVRDFGGSIYVLIPRIVRAAENIQAGDVIEFRRRPGSADTIMRLRPREVKEARR
jgi:hypothetical protein